MPTHIHEDRQTNLINGKKGYLQGTPIPLLQIVCL